MTSIRILGLAVSVIMTVTIIVGFLEGSLFDEGAQIWALPWGRVSLVDLYLGLTVFGIWVGFRERSVRSKLAWWLALIFLGNLAAGVYLTLAAFRARDFRQLLMGSRAGV